MKSWTMRSGQRICGWYSADSDDRESSSFSFSITLRSGQRNCAWYSAVSDDRDSSSFPFSEPETIRWCRMVLVSEQLCKKELCDVFYNVNTGANSTLNKTNKQKWYNILKKANKFKYVKSYFSLHPSI